VTRKTILLTGASGTVGYEAFKEFQRRQDVYNLRLLCLDRKLERKLFKPYFDDVEIVWGDIRSEVDVRKSVSGVDAVVHAAAVIPPLADRQPDLASQVNVGGTINLLTAMKRESPAPRMIYTSSISVYGDRLKDPEITVGDSLKPSIGDEYAKTKIKAEQMICQSGLEWTIFRLCGILTPCLDIQPLMFHMPLNTALEWCLSSDAGYALVEAISCKNVYGRIFNLGGGAKCRIEAYEFLNTTLPLFGVDPSAMPLNAFATRNFHSGYYADGDKLNDLLSFQRHTLEDYYKSLKRTISPLRLFINRCIPKAIIREYFVRISEPLKAIREDNQELIKRFYGSREAYDKLAAALVK
jgi:nucleoside-diphosphate-sugar epimerase